jgi:AraC-like DNA-binding protein
LEGLGGFVGIKKDLSALPILRLAHSQVFASYLQKVGTPIHRLFARVGLPVYCDDPRAFVTIRQSWELFDAAARLEDPYVGWHVGQYFGDSGITRNLLSRLEGAPTLYRALQDFVKLVSTEASHLELGILERPDEILFCTQYSTIKDWPGYWTSQAYQLEAYVDLVRQYVGPNWAPREIGIEHPVVPPVAKEHFADTRIRTNQPLGYITVPRSCLHLPPRGAVVESTGAAEELPSGKPDIVRTLGVLIEAHLADGYPSQRLAASLMDTSVRTLARRLSESGVTYRNLVDKLRLEAAKRHLLDPDKRIIDASAAVGFRDPAHFSRMFRRLAGVTPRQFRAVELAEKRRGVLFQQSATSSARRK